MTTYADLLRSDAERRIMASRFRLGEAAKNVWAIAHELGHPWALAVKPEDVPQMSLCDIWDASRKYLEDARWVKTSPLVPNIQYDGDHWEYNYADDQIRAYVCSEGFTAIEIIGQVERACIRFEGTAKSVKLFTSGLGYDDEPTPVADDDHWTKLHLFAYKLDRAGYCSGAGELVEKRV